LLFILIFSPHIASAAVIPAWIQELFYPKPPTSSERQEKNSQTLFLPKASALSPNEEETEEESIVPSTPKGVAPIESGPLRDSTEEEVVDSDIISLYVVRKGDTVSQIAKLYGVTTNTIFWANDLNRGVPLKEGQTLVILPISGVRYVIKEKDTIRSIAKKFKADIEDIERFNGITEETKLAVGESIIIPDGEIAPSEDATRPKGVITRYASLPLIQGYFMRPIFGGARSQGIHGRNGIDLASYLGSPIMAAADGIVILARQGGWGGGYGNYIVIQHSNGTQTLYAHALKILVGEGGRVNQGQTIALMGSSGKSTGVHLHFEVRGARNPF